MTDKSGIELVTGQIVKITGGYFKADNGTFLVKHSPGDPAWSGNDYSLKKCNKKGKESETKYSTAFWPLMITINSSDKRRAAREHNRNNATIEVISKTKTYRVKAKRNIWGNIEEWEEVVTETRYNELLGYKNCEVEIIATA